MEHFNIQAVVLRLRLEFQAELGVLCCLPLSGKHSSQKLPTPEPSSRTATQNNDETLPKPSSLPCSLSPLPPCLFLPRSLLPLNAVPKLKASLVLGVAEQMQLERPFFFLHLMEKEPTSGISSLSASSSGELVQYQVGASSQRIPFSNTKMLRRALLLLGELSNALTPVIFSATD